MTEPLSRTSALAERHRALGSELEDCNGMGTASDNNTPRKVCLRSVLTDAGTMVDDAIITPALN